MTGNVKSRILLVEDDAISRQVACVLLNRGGLEVGCAENGWEAVEMVSAGIYDLILMDVQMPEMDGLAATRKIRSMAGKKDIPILAMTANTSAEDIRACLEAGMHDVVSKPVNPENLFSMINKWLPEPGQPVSKETISPEVLPGAETADDAALQTQIEAIEGLDASTGLNNMSSDVQAYLRLLRQFAVTFMDDLKRLQVSLVRGENTRASRVAHTLKGAAGMLGLMRVQELAVALEGELLNQDNKEATTLLEALTTELKKLQYALSLMAG